MLTPSSSPCLLFLRLPHTPKILCFRHQIHLLLPQPAFPPPPLRRRSTSLHHRVPYWTQRAQQRQLPPLAALPLQTLPRRRRSLQARCRWSQSRHRRSLQPLLRWCQSLPRQQPSQFRRRRPPPPRIVVSRNRRQRMENLTGSVDVEALDSSVASHCRRHGVGRVIAVAGSAAASHPVRHSSLSDKP
ncbi:hypothetical protein VNO80_25994 [Phaseolus coccineus]|uniref:Uncharacterized protein n=1 Tax=Phaseolus coccineus TaxID=3886 RepID=A0AAN9LVN4_PHACN